MKITPCWRFRTDGKLVEPFGKFILKRRKSNLLSIMAQIKIDTFLIPDYLSQKHLT